MDSPGSIADLGYEWGEPWREEARALVDSRTPRLDTPQYQTDEDRLAAVASHGETVACTVCDPGIVPRS